MSELKYSKEQIIDACKEAGLGILECNSLITVLGCCQPEATKPAPKFVTCPKCKGNHAGIGIDGVETDCSYCENGMVQAIQQPKEERTAFEAWAGVEYRNSSHYTQFDMEYGWDAWQARAALASPADALVAGDRVDAERYRHLRELMQFSTPPNKPTTMKLRAALPAPEHQPHRDWMGEHFDASVDRTVDADIRACLTAEEIPEFDASRAAIQAQKDVHG